MLKRMSLKELGAKVCTRTVDIDICPYCSGECGIENMEEHIAMSHNDEYELFMKLVNMEEISNKSTVKKWFWLFTLQFDKIDKEQKLFLKAREDKIAIFLRR